MSQFDLNYRTFGSGSTPILLLHGWAGSHLSWQNIFYTSDLPVTWWAPDLPGHGASPVNGHVPTLDAYCQAVLGFIKAHRLRPQVVMAHSMGGLITLKLAHTHPDLFRQMVLINPVVTGAFGYQGFISRILRTQARHTIKRAMGLVLPLLQNRALFQTLLNPVPIDPDGRRSLEEDFTAMRADAAIDILCDMAQTTMLPVLSQIQHPTLVAVGAHDRTVPPVESAIAARYLPHAELTVFEARHRPHDTRIAAFIARLRDFLARHGIAKSGSS